MDDNEFAPSLTADDSLSSDSMTPVPRRSVNRCFPTQDAGTAAH